MAADVPTTEPTKFVAGDTVCWQITLSDYPADEYDMTYAFVTDGNQFTVTCTADGTDHYAEMDGTASNQDAGFYKWQRYVTDSNDDRVMVGTGTCEVLPNFAAQATGYDGRTDAEVMLDALNATLRGKASNDQLSMSIQGRSLARMSPEELLKWRNQMKLEVRRERASEKAALGLDTGLKLRTRF